MRQATDPFLPGDPAIASPAPQTIQSALTDPAAPFWALAESGSGTLAVLTKVQGRFYRPIGAAMAFLPDGRRVGSLSSGCVEADLAVHAARARRNRRPITLRYGQGAQNFDIRLPCGGGISVLLVPDPDASVLQQLCAQLSARQAATLHITPTSGRLALKGPHPTGGVKLDLKPDVRTIVVGTGPEALTFATVAASSGLQTLLFSPNDETLAQAKAAGLTASRLHGPHLPAEIAPDPWTAVALFFHDHGWEAGILGQALASPAFYVGAQGSAHAQAERRKQLQQAGCGEPQIERLKGPIGVVPAARDPRLLAASVLAEVLSCAPA